MRLFASLALLAALTSSQPARAYPLIAPRPVPSAIAGPTDPHVAAIFYNPAALAAPVDAPEGLRGVHLWFDGGARLDEGNIDRAPVDGKAMGSSTINWANLDAFAGVTWDLNTDSFRVGLATYTPMNDLSSYGDSPVRYHEIDQTFMVLEQTAAAAYQLTSRVSIGAAFTVAESWLSWRFARDVAPTLGTLGLTQANGLCGREPCGLENPLAAQRIRLRGFGWGLGFSVGIVGRPIDRLWLALSYTSHIFNTGQGPDLPMHDQTRAYVTPAPGQGALCPGPNGCSGNDLVVASVPDIIHVGVRVLVTPRFDLESTARWIHYSERAALDVIVQGGNLPLLGTGAHPAAIPQQQLYDRGLQDAFGVEMSGRWKLGKKLRLSPSIFFESSGVDKSAVSAAALDGPKLDVELIAEWRPTRWLTLGASAGATAYILGEVKSRFDSHQLAACVDAAYSLDACTAANAGQGLSSASGNYTLYVPHLSAAIGLEF